jgi:hypothetical protein
VACNCCAGVDLNDVGACNVGDNWLKKREVRTTMHDDVGACVQERSDSRLACSVRFLSVKIPGLNQQYQLRRRLRNDPDSIRKAIEQSGEARADEHS